MEPAYPKLSEAEIQVVGNTIESFRRYMVQYVAKFDKKGQVKNALELDNHPLTAECIEVLKKLGVKDSLHLALIGYEGASRILKF